jgi:SNF2 family DNA or RNA helicase
MQLVGGGLVQMLSSWVTFYDRDWNPAMDAQAQVTNDTADGCWPGVAA